MTLPGKGILSDPGLHFTFSTAGVGGTQEFEDGYLAIGGKLGPVSRHIGLVLSGEYLTSPWSKSSDMGMLTVNPHWNIFGLSSDIMRWRLNLSASIGGKIDSLPGVKPVGGAGLALYYQPSDGFPGPIFGLNTQVLFSNDHNDHLQVATVAGLEVSLLLIPMLLSGF